MTWGGAVVNTETHLLPPAPVQEGEEGEEEEGEVKEEEEREVKDEEKENEKEEEE